MIYSTDLIFYEVNTAEAGYGLTTCVNTAEAD